MSIATKQTIPYAELLDIVQGLLLSYPEECRNIHIDALQVYVEQTDGANWHIKSFRRSGDDNDLPECKQKILEDIRLLRASYDVAADG
ncbi:hypothetical protein ACFL48_01395 [Pseudomonadota bacterium]